MDKNRYIPVRQIGGKQTEKLSVVLDRKLNEKKLALQLKRERVGEMVTVMKTVDTDILPAFLDVEETNYESTLLFRYEDGVSLKEIMQERTLSISEVFCYVRAIGLLALALLNSGGYWLAKVDMEYIFVTSEEKIIFRDFAAICRTCRGSEQEKAKRQSVKSLRDFLMFLLDERLLREHSEDNFCLSLFCRKQEKIGSIEGFLKDLNWLEKVMRYEEFLIRHKGRIRVLCVGIFVMLVLGIFAFSGEDIDKSAPENSVEQGALTESDQSESDQSESDQSESDQSESAKSENTQSENAKSENTHSENNQSASDNSDNALSENNLPTDFIPEGDMTVEQHHEKANYLLENQESVSNSLLKAKDHLEAAREQILQMEGDTKLEYQMENLSMLSIIYKLLGKKDVGNRTAYYEHSMECIQEFMKLNGAKESRYYRARLSDLVELMEEVGDWDAAISYLKMWEEEHPDYGKEFYFAHAFLLMKCEGNEEELRMLGDKMDKIAEVKEDFRYEQVKKMMELYGKEEDVYGYEKGNEDAYGYEKEDEDSYADED